MTLDILSLTRERFGDLAALFEQGGDPRWCWCAYFNVRGLSWDNSTAEANRALLERRAAAERPPGLVAYRDGVAVGWVSVAPRTEFERLAHSRVLAPVDDRPVWSIVCFVVSRSARGTGIARALLAAAIDFARAHGATTLEGYPADTAGRRIPSSSVYQGSLSMFQAAGFEVVARRQANRASPYRPIVRLDLGRPGPPASDEGRSP